MTRSGSSPKVGFLSALNYYSRDAFSGILWSMREAMLRQGIRVVDLGSPYHPTRLHRLMGKVRRRLGRGIADGEVADRQGFADVVNRQIREHGCDVVFAPVASAALSAVSPAVPVIYASDATYRVAAPMYFAAHSETERQACDGDERRSIEMAAQLVYSSRWAADSAVADYGADPARVTIIPFGANLIHEPTRLEAIRQRPQSALRLLFLGRDWERKGGPVVQATCDLLQQRGVPVSVTVVGCRPPAVPSTANWQIIPFLSKDTPRGRREFEALWKSHDVLFLPTRGDTFGIVFCEAAAHGMPVITSDVGGTASVVDDGTTGFVLPLNASPDAYADIIVRIAADDGLYERLSRAARERYESRLNWSAWARDLAGVIDRAAAEPAGRPANAVSGAATSGG